MFLLHDGCHAAPMSLSTVEPPSLVRIVADTNFHLIIMTLGLHGFGIPLIGPPIPLDRTPAFCAFQSPLNAFVRKLRVIIDSITTEASNFSKVRRNGLKTELQAMREWVKDYMPVHDIDLAKRKTEICARAIHDTNKDLVDLFSELSDEARSLRHVYPFAPSVDDSDVTVRPPNFHRLSSPIHEGRLFRLVGRMDAGLSLSTIPGGATK